MKIQGITAMYALKMEKLLYDQQEMKDICRNIANVIGTPETVFINLKKNE